MQIHCTYCGAPLNISRKQAEAALEMLHAEDLTYYEVRCPKCRKMNKVSREVLTRAAPTWKPKEAE
ncbi:MAG TPA: hypothetical protein ENJ54_09375 [Chloroflexi bacterium]|nr:hypothetical protein [Chloroflexota bacterium]